MLVKVKVQFIIMLINRNRTEISKGAALLVGRFRDRFPVVSLDFSLTYFLLTVTWPWGRLSP